MTNKNFPVKPVSSQKAAPVKKKDIHESLQEANESAEKLNVRMTELASRFVTMQEKGITTKLDAHSEELINNLLAQMKATPKEIEKILNTMMDKVIKQVDDEIAKIKTYAIIVTLIFNTIITMVIYSLI